MSYLLKNFNSINKKLFCNQNFIGLIDLGKLSYKFFSSYNNKEECKDKKDDLCKKLNCENLPKEKVDVKKEEISQPKDDAKKCLYDDIECCLGKF